MKNLLAAFALILVASSFAHAQIGSLGCVTSPPGTFTFTGKLIIPGNDHPEIFEVFLMARMGEQIIAHTIANWSGEFCFIGVESARYDLLVRLEGFKELREVVDVPPVFPSIFWLTPADREVVLDERLRGYPKEAIDEYVMAAMADANKDFKEVVRHLEKVVSLAADWYDAHCELGGAYEEIQRYTDAEKEYRRALELKPDGMRAIMSLGRLLVLVSDDMINAAAAQDTITPILEQAHEVLTAALKRDPTSAMASYLIGAVDFRLASYGDAEKELKHALQLDTTIFPARIMLVNVFVAQKLWDQALDHLDQFILENPRSPYRTQAMETRASVVRHMRESQ